MKMFDMSEKSGIGCCVEESHKSKKKYYPHEYYSTEQMPSLEGCQMGDKVKLVFEGEITGVEERQNDEGTKINYTIEIKKGGVEAIDSEDNTSPLNKAKKISQTFKSEEKEDSEN